MRSGWQKITMAGVVAAGVACSRCGAAAADALTSVVPVEAAVPAYGDAPAYGYRIPPDFYQSDRYPRQAWPPYPYSQPNRIIPYAGGPSFPGGWPERRQQAWGGTWWPPQYEPRLDDPRLGEPRFDDPRLGDPRLGREFGPRYGAQPRFAPPARWRDRSTRPYWSGPRWRSDRPPFAWGDTYRQPNQYGRYAYGPRGTRASPPTGLPSDRQRLPRSWGPGGPSYYGYADWPREDEPRR